MSKLRVVSWNCHFNREREDSESKKTAIRKFLSEADIVILQELTKKDFKSLEYPSERSDWYGDDKDAFGQEPLGIAVFSKEGFTVERLYNGEAQFRYVLPYKISRLSDGETLPLFVVWTKKGYEKILFEALEYYKPFSPNTIIMGDYNIGARSDGYEDRLETLEKNMVRVGLVNCAKGEELKKPTFLGSKGAYQNDFCFASDNLAANAKLKVCDDDKEHKLSDHYPIVVDFS
jgi:endonuclease/exonuclease/phosphatase family metal-dependent hydrolase